jgi:acetyltransferase-like isoleucine patch superfamily enzyme
MNDQHQQYRFQEVIEDQRRSALHKYQEAVMGHRKIPALIRYEILNLLLGGLPGMLGLGLRRFFYPALFGAVGRSPVFGHHLNLRGGHRIFLGDNVMIDDYAFLSSRGEGEQSLCIGNNVLIGRFCQLKVREGKMTLGDKINLNHFCYLGTASTLSIGDHSLLGTNCFIGGIQHGYSDLTKPIAEQQLSERGGIRIGKDVWIGAHAVINDGVSIGDGAIIGSNAVVTKDIPAFTIAAGVPAKVLGQR